MTPACCVAETERGTMQTPTPTRHQTNGCLIVHGHDRIMRPKARGIAHRQDMVGKARTRMLRVEDE